MVTNLASSYASMIREMADLYAKNQVIHAQLKTLQVTAEEWDPGRGQQLLRRRFCR